MKLKIVSLTVALLLAASGCHAKEPVFSPWVFYKGVTTLGTPYCSLVSSPKSGNVAQNIVVKYLKGDDPRLVVDLYKDTWNYPQGRTRSVMFDFVDNQPLTVHAFADAHILDAEIPQEYLAVFMLELAQRPGMQVIFADGKEATWYVANKGALSGVNKLMACING